MSLQILVTCVSLAAAAISFGLYTAQTINAIRATPAGDVIAQAKGFDPKSLSVDEITKLVDALSTLSTSLAKAGPTLTSLIGSLLFLAIAAATSGALRG